MNIYRNLRGNQLTGELPWSDLPAIVYLLVLYFLNLDEFNFNVDCRDLGDNQLSGELPDSWSSFTNVQVL